MLPLLGYFLSMIAALAAAVWVMLGLSNISTSERASHYPHPRPEVERNVTAVDEEPRLFMLAPETKDRSPAKNMEANSATLLKNASPKCPKCSPVGATTMNAPATGTR
jgi:hypothetical protein